MYNFIHILLSCKGGRSKGAGCTVARSIFAPIAILISSQRKKWFWNSVKNWDRGKNVNCTPNIKQQGQWKLWKIGFATVSKKKSWQFSSNFKTIASQILGVQLYTLHTQFHSPWTASAASDMSLFLSVW